MTGAEEMRVRVKLGSGKGRQGFVGRGRSWNFILVAMRVIEYFLLRLRTHAHAHSFPGSPFFPPRASSSLSFRSHQRGLSQTPQGDGLPLVNLLYRCPLNSSFVHANNSINTRL